MNGVVTAEIQPQNLFNSRYGWDIWGQRWSWLNYSRVLCMDPAKTDSDQEKLREVGFKPSILIQAYNPMQADLWKFKTSLD